MMLLSRLKEVVRSSRDGTDGRGRFSAIGLDLGSARIKLVQLQQHGGVISVYRRRDYPSPGVCLQGGGCADPSALAGTLYEILQNSGCRRNRVYICLHGQAASLRRVTLPPLSLPEVAQAMRWEAERQLPANHAEESVFDYAFLEKRSVQGKTVFEFILAAASKAVTESCAQGVARAGFHPEAIECAPFALGRALRWCGALTPHPCLETLLLVHIGAETSDLLVLHRGRYRYHRPISLGVNHFYRDREAAAAGQSGAPENDTPLRTARPLHRRGAADTAQKLAEEAARSLEFYAFESDYPEKRCQALLLCGGGAMIDGLDVYLGDKLDLEASRFNPFAPPYFSGGGEDGDGTNGPLYTAALGCALRGWS